MKKIVISLFLFLFTLFLIGDDTRKVTRNFPVDTSRQVVIDFHDSDGDITIEKHDKNEIAIEFVKEFKGSNGNSSHSYFLDIDPVIEFSGNQLRMEVKYPKNWFSLSFSRVDVRTRILTPAGSDVKIRVSDGDARLADLKGSIQATSSDGDLAVTRCRGRLALTTSDGNIDVTEAAGDLYIRASDGDIAAQGTFTAFDLETSDGDCRLVLAPGSKLDRDCRMAASDGDLTLVHPDSLAFVLNARTSDGGIRAHTRFDRTSHHSETRLQAERGQGGFTVNLRTSDGDITIEGKS